MSRGSGPSVRKVERARDWLFREAGLERLQVGLIGFCITGGFALAMGRGWGAVSCNYGDCPPPS